MTLPNRLGSSHIHPESISIYNNTTFLCIISLKLRMLSYRITTTFVALNVGPANDMSTLSTHTLLVSITTSFSPRKSWVGTEGMLSLLFLSLQYMQILNRLKMYVSYTSIKKFTTPPEKSLVESQRKDALLDQGKEINSFVVSSAYIHLKHL